MNNTSEVIILLGGIAVLGWGIIIFTNPSTYVKLSKGWVRILGAKSGNDAQVLKTGKRIGIFLFIVGLLVLLLTLLG